jgi:localization factor PodJL
VRKKVLLSQRNKAKLPWSVKGVSPDSRSLAKSAAADHGATMGEWLSHVIRRVGASEAAGKALPPADGAVAPTESGALVPAQRDGDRVDDAALVAGVHARLESTEARLLDVLDGLEDVVERLSDRITRLERRIDRGDRGPT